jgi:hypothetical protein
MQPIIKLNHASIQRELRESVQTVKGILRSLGVDEHISPLELYKFILNDLKTMHFEVKYDRRLLNVHGNQSVTAFTEFSTSNRTDGGIIRINQDEPKKEQLEALFHEYIHIKDDSLPIYTTNGGPIENKAVFYKFFLELSNQANMGEYTSALPEQMQLDILTNADDIGKVLEKYQELFRYILDDLKKMNFVIRYDNDLIYPYSALTEFNTSNRTGGGIIRLSRDYSTNENLEALYNEYVKIIGYSVPIYEIYTKSLQYKAAVDKIYQEMIEFKADMRTYTLLMPPEELKKSLMENAYNVEEILKKYHYLEKSSVLQWIAINSEFPCHFAWVMLEKDNDDKTARKVTHDNCYYDHQNDPQPFGIEAVLDTGDSAAALAVMNRQSVTKESAINGKAYFCYAYYESGLSKDVRNETIPGIVSVAYDRLLVIGWEKAVHNTIQMVLQRIKPFRGK